ncbi:MAG TPA: isoprenylcysteine carboxylmethyltransferase family protein [Chthoniobacterales bacterium]
MLRVLINPTPQQVSQRYALAQTTLLCAFAVVVLFLPGPLLFFSAIAISVGKLLCLIGVLVLVLGLISLRGTIQIAPEPRAGKQLVQKGIYRYFRHPIYTGIICCVIGLWLKRPAAWVAIAGIVVIAFLVMKVRVEEEFLARTYPDYAEYKRRSWGLFPGLRS